MSVERTLFAFGGIMVMLTCLLALFHHPNWTWFTLFIGFKCFQSSFTGFCPPAWLMKKFGLKTEAELATEGLGESRFVSWVHDLAAIDTHYALAPKLRRS